MEIQLQFSFRKYLYLYSLYRTITTYFRILYHLHWAHGGSNSWEKPTSSGTNMEQWSVTLLPIGKPSAEDSMVSLFWGWHFERRACACRPVNQEWCNNMNNVTRYKTLKRTKLTTLKVLPATETLIWLNVIGWPGGWVEIS